MRSEKNQGKNETIQDLFFDINTDKLYCSDYGDVVFPAAGGCIRRSSDIRHSFFDGNRCHLQILSIK
jgi:hypothetical protein